ncbi:TadE family type IV pilus minor pilin [Streptomyces sp. WMMC1477]|uniref:TadE family type IV pilus minor pilin n=1 Tax=unclassified Streptomyces TaxID=2593676 RepID=UPI003FCEC4E2
MPSLALLAALFVWGLMAGAAQIQCLDAARAGARAAARAEPAEAVLAAARSAAPEDAEVSVGREGDLVRVRVQAHLAGPGAVGLDVDGEAVAHVEAG